jgi:hypothetical protein
MQVLYAGHNGLLPCMEVLIKCSYLKKNILHRQKLCAAVSDFQIQFAIHYSSLFPGARAAQVDEKCIGFIAGVLRGKNKGNRQ